MWIYITPPFTERTRLLVPAKCEPLLASPRGRRLRELLLVYDPFLSSGSSSRLNNVRVQSPSQPELHVVGTDVDNIHRDSQRGAPNGVRCRSEHD